MKRHHLWRLVFVSVLAMVSLSLAAYVVTPVAAQERPLRILFMHHSTGGGLIWEGNLREEFTDRGYEFWDHGYNDEGLVDNNGNWLGINWAVPDDNTDPDGWYRIFAQPVTDPPGNTLSHMLAFDVILFKSCFPASDIDSEERFEDYRRYYLSIRDVMDRYPDKLFIPFTTPPLVPNATSPENAARAQRWAQYLTSDEYLAGHPNVRVFDFFHHLADENGTLKAEYRVDEWDSHPNTLANQTVAAILVDFVDEAIQDFTPGEPLTQSAPGGDVDQADAASSDLEGEAQDDETASPGEGLPGLDQIGDFESGLSGDWWDWAEQAALSWSTAQPGHDSDHALQVTFDLASGGYGGIGVNFAANPAWENAQGISFYWRADQAGLAVRFALAVQDPARPDAEPSEATPFEVSLVTSGDDWEQVTLLWTDFAKAEWFGEAGVDEFDPAHVIWLAFDLGGWERAQQGTIWIDDIRLVMGD